MGKNYKKAIGTFIRNFYGADSYLTFGFFNHNLSLRIARYNEGNRNVGFNHSDMRDGITATVNFEGAYYLYKVAMSIVNDINRENEKKALLERRDTIIILDYKPDHNGRMLAYLTIGNKIQSISYGFTIRVYQDKKNGQMVVQSELGAFAKTIEGYLLGVGADRHFDKLPTDYENSQEGNQKNSYTTGNDSGYQQGNNGSYSRQ